MGRRLYPDIILETPARNSVLLGGKWINISALARAEDLDISYLSKVLSGDRRATIEYYMTLGRYLNMGLEEILNAIDIRKQERARKEQKIIDDYKERARLEDEANARRKERGLPAIPPTPGTRIESA